jgi:hypothetical protein
MSIEVRIEGLDELVARCDQAADIIAKYNTEATEQNLRDLKEQAIKNAPYKKGTLKRSIAYKMDKLGANCVGTYGSSEAYARILELGGTIPATVIKPKARNQLAWYDPTSPYAVKKGKYAGWVFSKKSNLPARYIAAKPYLFPALVVKIDSCIARYKKAWEDATGEIESIKK